MRLLRFWRGGVAGAMVAMSAGLALAAPDPTFTNCTKEPTPADVNGAKGAHVAATQFFERADYERAIQYWKDAYGFDCSRPGILINIGSAQEKKGDRAAAIATYEAYLVRAPNAPDAPTVAEKVKNLKASLQPPPPPSSAPVAPPVAAPPPPAPVAPPAPTAAPVVQEKRPYGVAPIVLTAAGGVAAVVGAVLLPVGLSQVSSAEKTCPNHAHCLDANAITEGNAGRTKISAGGGLLIGGLAVAGGGILWQLLLNAPKPAAASARETGARSTSFTPIFGPGAAGAALSGRF